MCDRQPSRRELKIAVLSRQNLGEGRQHKSLKGLSPAMEAGINDMLWSMADLAEMVDAAAPKPGKRGPYKKRAA